MEILCLLSGAVLAYLLGSFSSAVWIGRWFYGKDVRKEGSGNAGTTNTIRVLGWKPGVVVLILDAFKGWCAVFCIPELMIWLTAVEFGENAYICFQILLALTVLLGHVFPLYTGFKGGKGVATMAGIALALYPQSFGVAISIFVVVFLLSRYVSLSSILAALSFPLIEYFYVHQTNWILMGFAIAVAVFIPVTHRKNIVRLCTGKESKLKFKK